MEGRRSSHSNAKWDKNGNQFNNFVCIPASTGDTKYTSSFNSALSSDSKYLSCVRCEQSFLEYFYIFSTSSAVCDPTARKEKKYSAEKKPTTIQHSANTYSIS